MNRYDPDTRRRHIERRKEQSDRFYDEPLESFPRDSARGPVQNDSESERYYRGETGTRNAPVQEYGQEDRGYNRDVRRRRGQLMMDESESYVPLGPRGEWHEDLGEPGHREDSFRDRGYQRERMGRGRNEDRFVQRSRSHERDRYEERGFRGRGPRNYRRSDERILEDCCERLMHSDDVDATEMELVVNGGEVTLKGHVSNRREKLIAEEICAEVGGVKDVRNEIRVGAPDRRQESDERPKARSSARDRKNRAA